MYILLIHVSETYNTIMSLHALGISVDIHIELFDNSLKKNFFNYILSVHGVMIDLFLFFP
jgi:hypothetical protein